MGICRLKMLTRQPYQVAKCLRRNPLFAMDLTPVAIERTL